MQLCLSLNGGQETCGNQRIYFLGLFSQEWVLYTELGYFLLWRLRNERLWY